MKTKDLSNKLDTMTIWFIKRMIHDKERLNKLKF